MSHFEFLPQAVSQSAACGAVGGGALATRGNEGEGDPQDRGVPSLRSSPLPASVGGGRFILNVVGSRLTGSQHVRWCCPSCGAAHWSAVRYRWPVCVVALVCRVCGWRGGRGASVTPVLAVIQSLEAKG